MKRDIYKNKVFLIKNKYQNDKRGFFLKLKKNDFQNFQNCFSYNRKKFTIRGLHFQKYPSREIKIITCLKGSIFDVVVNINKKSKNYLKWYSFKLNEKNKHSLYVGKDYAHGFMTLEDNTIVSYQILGNYISKYQAGLLWSDSKIGIKWPHKPKIISNRDKNFLNI